MGLSNELSSGFQSFIFSNTDIVACVKVGSRLPFSNVSSYIGLRMGAGLEEKAL